MLDLADASGATWPMAIVMAIGAFERVFAWWRHRADQRAHDAKNRAIERWKPMAAAADPDLGRRLTDAVADELLLAGPSALKSHTRALARDGLNVTRVLGPEIQRRAASGEYRVPRDPKPQGSA